jgi:hypothetical protein
MESLKVIKLEDLRAICAALFDGLLFKMYDECRLMQIYYDERNLV